MAHSADLAPRCEALFQVSDSLRVYRDLRALLRVLPLQLRPVLVTICSTLSAMDIAKMLAELKTEREGVEQAILVLERIASGRGKRRGRPPKWMTGAKRRGRPLGSKNKPKDE